MQVKLPPNATMEFAELCDYLDLYLAPEWAPDTKKYIAAQLALESGWGTSKLAKNHRNFAGMKWRDIMRGWAVPVTYIDWQGKKDKYCAFKSVPGFVRGFFHRLDNLGPYDGWREAAKKGGLDYITFVGPIWLGMSKADNQAYIQKVHTLVETRFG